MAREGYLILDSDLHMMEPDDLWARYLDEPYRANAPRFFGAQHRNSPTIPRIRTTPTSSREWRCKGFPFRRTAKCRAPRRHGANCGAEAGQVIRTSMSRGLAASIRSRP